MEKLKINGYEYLTIRSASKLLNETYSSTHKKLGKFKTIKIGNLLLINKDTIIEYKEWKNKYKTNEA